MKKAIWIALLSFFFAQSHAQQPFQREKRDHIWLLGYGAGGTRIDFSHQPPAITYETRNLDFDETNTTICTPEGELLFYTNSLVIHNNLNQLIENGDGLNPDPYTATLIDWGGYLLPQGALILPYPGIPHRYIIFHSTISITVLPVPSYSFYHVPMNCYYTIVDMAPDQAGQVLQKNTLILSDTLDFGKLTAVRHANGRDWWVAQQEYFANRQYAMLLNPDTVMLKPSQTLGPNRPTGLGQATFSPDGKKYAILSLAYIIGDQFLDVYDFDRCSGTWSNPVPLVYVDSVNGGGVAFSPNSRFLYVSSYRKLYQYDMQADDIAASREIIAVYDGFESPVPTMFFLTQLAPDGKIYLNTRSTTDRLHVIHNPNAKGTACQIEQHGITLSAINSRGLHSSPFFGLGPEDGSPCDTLGIDHHPQADFRYVTESATANFYDYSQFFPTQWYWTFGDGQSATDRDPVHAYAQSGIYEVCLIVSNGIASDTLCREVEIVLTGTATATLQPPTLRVFPNPTTDEVVLQMPNSAIASPEDLIWTLYDALGRQVRHVGLQHPRAQTVVNLEKVAPGMYVWQLRAAGMLLETGKLSVVK